MKILLMRFPLHEILSPKFVVEELLLLTCRQIKVSEEKEGGVKGIQDRINKYFEGMNKNLERRRCLFVLDDCVRSKSYFHPVIAQIY